MANQNPPNPPNPNPHVNPLVPQAMPANVANTLLVLAQAMAANNANTPTILMQYAEF
jgi:hypothetical protein